MFKYNCSDCCSCSDDRGSPGENLHSSNRSGQPDEWPNNRKRLFLPESKWTTALTLLWPLKKLNYVLLVIKQLVIRSLVCIHDTQFHQASVFPWLSLDGFVGSLTEGNVLDDGAFCDCAILAKECPEFFHVCLWGHISHKNIFTIVKYLNKKRLSTKRREKIGHLETELTKVLMKIHESNSPDILEQQQDRILLFCICLVNYCILVATSRYCIWKLFWRGSCDQLTKMELVKQRGEQHFWTALALMGD